MNYLYSVEGSKGELRFSLADPETKKEIWNQSYPSFTEDVKTGELIEDMTLIDYGVMKDMHDTAGLEKYLKDCTVIQSGDTITLNPIVMATGGKIGKAEQRLVSSLAQFHTPLDKYIGRRVKFIDITSNAHGIVGRETFEIRHIQSLYNDKLGFNLVAVTQVHIDAYSDSRNEPRIDFINSAANNFGKAASVSAVYLVDNDGKKSKVQFTEAEKNLMKNGFSEGGKPLGSTGLFEQGGDILDRDIDFLKSEIKKIEEILSRPLRHGEKQGPILPNLLEQLKEQVAKLEGKFEDGGKPLGSTGLFSEGGSVDDLSGSSKAFCEYFIENHIARKELKKDNPKYKQQIDGLKEAIDKGYLFVEEKTSVTIVRAKQKLADLYKYAAGGSLKANDLTPGTRLKNKKTFVVVTVSNVDPKTGKMQLLRNGEVMNGWYSAKYWEKTDLKEDTSNISELRSRINKLYIKGFKLFPGSAEHKKTIAELNDLNAQLKKEQRGYANGGKPLGSTGLFEKGGKHHGLIKNHVVKKVTDMHSVVGMADHGKQLQKAKSGMLIGKDFDIDVDGNKTTLRQFIKDNEMQGVEGLDEEEMDEVKNLKPGQNCAISSRSGWTLITRVDVKK